MKSSRDMFQGLNLDTRDQEVMLCAVSNLPQPIFVKGKLSNCKSSADLMINHGVV